MNESLQKYKELIEKYKPLSREEIIDRLKEMTADKCGPLKKFSFLVPNDEYDPDNFSQEIEDSEENLETWSKIWEEINKPDFDFVWNNTLGKLPRNSENWKNNHGKICPVKQLGLKFVSKCVVHKDGTRDYYSEDIVNKIMNINEKYGGIINFC